MAENPNNRFLVMGTYYPASYTAEARGVSESSSSKGDLAIYMSQKALREMDVSKLYMADDSQNPHGVYETDPVTGKQKCVKGPSSNGRAICDFTDKQGNRKVIWMTMGTEKGIAQARDIITGSKKELSLAHRAELWQYPDRQEIVYVADHIALLPGDVPAGRDGCHIDFIVPLSPKNTLMKEIHEWVNIRKNKERANENFKAFVEKLKAAVVTPSVEEGLVTNSVAASQEMSEATQTPAAAPEAPAPAPVAQPTEDATMTEASEPTIAPDTIAAIKTIEDLEKLEKQIMPKTDQEWSSPEKLAQMVAIKNRRAEILSEQLTAERERAAAETAAREQSTKEAEKLRESLARVNKTQFQEASDALDKLLESQSGTMSKDKSELLKKALQETFNDTGAGVSDNVRYLVSEVTCAAARNTYLASQMESRNFGAPNNNSFLSALRATSSGSHYEQTPAAPQQSTLGKRAATVPEAKRPAFSNDDVVSKWVKPCYDNYTETEAFKMCTKTDGFVSRQI